MLTVAVTGGIGAGKSTVSAALAGLGAVVVDSDRLARQVVEPGTPGLAAVVREFGAEVLAPDGSLDRGGMGRIVFGDARARSRLEAIVHPLVRAAFAAARDAAGPDAIVVNDIPLVRTVADAAAFHLVVTVAADDERRLRRLIERGLTRTDALARMRSQISDDERRALSDVWLRNDGDEHELRCAVTALWSRRLVPMAANIAARRPAAWGDGDNRGVASGTDDGDRSAASSGDGDDRGPASGGDGDPAPVAVLCARVSAAAGGLPCEPSPPASARHPRVVSLRVTVPDLPAADRLAEPLADAGFPRLPGQAHEPSGPVERRHGSADPGRPVDLRVRVDRSAV